MAEMLSLPVLTPQPAELAADRFTVDATLGTQSARGLCELETDLLVVCAATNYNATRLQDTFPEPLRSNLKQQLSHSGFSGQANQTVVVDGDGSIKARLLLVAGIGSFACFRGCALCAVFHNVLTVALERGCNKITWVIPANRQTARSMNLKGVVATMTCRMSQFVFAHPESSNLQIEIHCTPQAARHVRSGLKAAGARCSVCDS